MRLEDGIVYWDQSGRHKCSTEGTANEGELRKLVGSLDRLPMHRRVSIL